MYGYQRQSNMSRQMPGSDMSRVPSVSASNSRDGAVQSNLVHDSDSSPAIFYANLSARLGLVSIWSREYDGHKPDETRESEHPILPPKALSVRVASATTTRKKAKTKEGAESCQVHDSRVGSHLAKVTACVMVFTS
jgi:hypothetical protein